MATYEIDCPHCNKIQESYQRTKNNPEYIKKLSDLGCTSIDIRIDPYYK